MTTVVLDSKDLVKSLETGEIPVPAEVAADRAGPQKEAVKAPEKPPETKSAETATTQADDEEDENGLTARQRAEFTEAMRKTIAKKHRQVKEAEEFAADQYNNRRLAETRAAELERELAELKKQATPVETVEEAKPKREDFQTEDAYRDALVDFRVREQLAKEKADAAKRAAEEIQAKMLETIRARVQKAIELVPDYEETIGNVDQRVPPHIANYMQQSDKFAELGYYFAKNPKELVRLSAMPARNYAEVMKIGIEMDRISAKVKPFAPSEPDSSAAKANGHGAEKPSHETESAAGSAGPSTETESAREGADPSKPRESAPVIRPLSAGSTHQVEKDPSQRSTREEIAAWQRQRSANLGLRKRH